MSISNRKNLFIQSFLDSKIWNHSNRRFYFFLLSLSIKLIF